MASKNRNIALPALLLAFAIRATGLAAETKPAPEENRKKSFIILPIVSYAPETRWAGGLAGGYIFQPSWSRDKSRPSTVVYSAVATQRGQYIFKLEPEIFIGDSAAIVGGRIELQKYPDTFYGLGNETSFDAAEGYTSRQVSFSVYAKKKIWAGKKFFAGVSYSYDHYRLGDLAAGGRLASSPIPGNAGGTISGWGLSLRWDNRDNIIFPRTGGSAELSAVWHARLFGSDYSYSKVKVDVRFFVPVFGSHVLAFQAKAQAAFGDVPFMALPRLGGDGLLRGYDGARFRDKILAAAQVEYRVPLFWRIGLVGFAGLGQVADRFDRLGGRGLKPSLGFGLRFNLDPPDGLNLRLDFGFGRKSDGNYVSGGESF